MTQPARERDSAKKPLKTMKSAKARTRPEVTAAVGKAMHAFHTSLLDQIQEAIESNDVVVVGMATNPHVRRVRAALAEAGVDHHYIGIGGYLSKWKERLAVKLWSGWPTFPQVFVKGTLFGGEDLTKAALADGSLKKALAD